MQDREMWLVIRDLCEDGGVGSDEEYNSLRAVRLSDIERISTSDDDGFTYVSFYRESTGRYTPVSLNPDIGEGIVYKGTFTNCFDYINKKENFK